MKSLTRLIVFAALVVPVRADFQAGLEAYNRGEFETAFKEWQPLADKGDANSQYNLGMLYARGLGVPKDYRKASEWYERAAEQGVAAAQYNLGVIYANGQGGVPQNVTEARKWFQKAAEKQVAEAEDSLGYFYGQGQGVAKDYGEAGKWYRKAAEAGVASAQYNLGVMYDLGQGVDRNFPEALKWYRKAADQGYAGALCNIGILYYNAQGVERDLAQAYAWFSLCEQAGDARGGQLRRLVEERIKPEDLEKGKQIAAAWHPSVPARQTDSERLFVRMEPKTEPAAAQATAGAPASPTQPPKAPAASQPASAAEAAQAAGGTPGRAPAAAAVDAAASPPSPVPTPPSPQSAPAAVQSYWAGVDRIVAVGDVFGDFEQFFTVLESAKLIDGNGDWVGGAAHLVQTGNIPDFGPDSRKIMDLLMRLEKQATAAGGGVHCLIGNHEAMDMYGDLRFVSPGEFSAFRPQDLESAAPIPKPGEVSGFAEQRAAFAPDGVYGRWIAGHNAIVKIDNTLFVHAGIGPKYVNWDMDRVNQAVRRELTRLDELHGGVVTDPQGPLLFTGLAKGNEAEMAPLVDRVLSAYGVQRIVVGHTYADGAVTPRFGGKVILVNVGLSRAYDNAGKLACLVIEGGHPYALHRGQKLELPKDEGVDMLRYLREAAALDPQPSPLASRIARLANRPRQ